MSVPRLSISIAIEGTPEIRLEAGGADLDALIAWLSRPEVVERIDALAALVTSRTIDP
jgi:hypothetical protein